MICILCLQLFQHDLFAVLHLKYLICQIAGVLQVLQWNVTGIQVGGTSDVHNCVYGYSEDLSKI